MAEYIITTESTTDLSKQLETELDIKILPLTYNLDGVETEDTPSSDNTRIKEFYNKLRNGSMSSTSQINFQTFIDEFSKYLTKSFLFIKSSLVVLLTNSILSSIKGKLSKTLKT